MKYNKFLFSMILATLPALAQSLPSFQVLPFRDSSQFYWDGTALIEAKNGNRDVTIHDIEIGTTRKVHLPSNSLGVTVRNGVESCIRLLREKGKSSILFSRRRMDEDWVDFPTSLNRPNDITGVPEFLYESEDTERFLGVSHFPGFTKGKEASCWAWWRQRRDGTLEADALIPIELEDSIFGAVAAGQTYPQIQFWGRNRGLAPMLEHPIRVPGAFLLVSWNAGIIWILKDVHPWPSRTVRLVSLTQEQLSGAHGHPPVLLGIQPLKDGNVLLAFRDEDSIREATRKPGAPSNRQDVAIPGPTDPNPAAEPKPRIKVCWKVLDPALGTLADADFSVIGEAPTHFSSETELSNISIGYNDKGRLFIQQKITTKSPLPGK